MSTWAVIRNGDVEAAPIFPNKSQLMRRTTSFTVSILADWSKLLVSVISALI